MQLLDQIEAEGLLQARGVFGFWPAYAEGDDVVLANGVTFPMLRQQAEKGPDRPILADFVAPVETGLAIHVALSLLRPALVPTNWPSVTRPSMTTTGHHGEGAGGPAGAAFAEYGSAHNLGLPGRTTSQRRPNCRGALPRHKTGLRLPRPAPITH